MLEEVQKLPADSVHTIRCLDVVNRLIHANKDLPGIQNINWTLNVVESKYVEKNFNAFAFPVLNLLFLNCSHFKLFVSIFEKACSHVPLNSKIEIKIKTGKIAIIRVINYSLDLV